MYVVTHDFNRAYLHVVLMGDGLQHDFHPVLGVLFFPYPLTVLRAPD